MARGGINKAVVQKARQALLDRGEHPSIDAVRIELGNTGSKTTIHRYLKELETLYPVQADRAPVLSDALTSLVGQLSRQLEEEGDARIAQAEAAFEQQREALEEQLQASRQALAALEQQHRIQGEALASESTHLETCRSTLQAEQTRNATLSQAVGELNLRLADKDEQIQSLEDKHQHARDALEHYRSASREQREQDQRRHEAQVQQLQVEVRQMQQTLIVKQDELTRLNRDNERLLVEMRQAHKECTVLQDRGEAQAQEARTLGANLAQSLGAREELLRQLQGLAEQRALADEQKREALRDVERLQQAIEALQAQNAAKDS